MKPTGFNLTGYSSIWVLIGANIFPLIGVLFLGFNALHVLLLYWTESAVIGFYWILKIVILKPPSTEGISKAAAATRLVLSIGGKIFLICFFLFHFGMFMMVHLLFIISFFSQEMIGAFSSVPFSLFAPFRMILPSIWIGIVMLFVSHGYSFYTNFIQKKEYLKTKPNVALFQPYQRIIIMQFTLIIGGFLYIASGQPASILFLFILIKIGVDLRAHLKERKQAEFQQGFTKLFDI